MTESFSIQVTHLKKKLGLNQALADASLTFEGGKIHGIIGPEGAGKTTLMRLLMGLLKPNDGQIIFLNQGQAVPFKAVRNKMAYMPQQQSLYADLSIEEHLDFFRTLYQIDPNEYAARRQELLDITQLQPFVDRPVGQLSGGMYKKVGLMCALLRWPDIILLDEPTNGVDPISRREFWDLLYRLLDRKILILFATAYMDEAERCSVVHLLESGRTIAEGEPADMLAKEGVSSFDALFLKHEAKRNGALT